MRLSSNFRFVGFFACIAFAACGGSADTGGDTTGGDTGDDTASGGDGVGNDSSSDTRPSDTRPSDSPTDTTPGGDTPADSVVTDVPSETPADTPTETASCAGIECAGFPASFVKGCTVDDNCVGEMHQADCCGAMHALGMNHSQAGAFCAAEVGGAGSTACRSKYPTPAPCSSMEITADDGKTTTDPTKVAVRCDVTGPAGMCKTFVCGAAGGPPCPFARRIGACP